MTALSQHVETWHFDPLGWVMWAFPWSKPGALATSEGPELWQARVLTEIGKGLSAGACSESHVIRSAVASGHGVGKSALVCWLVLWWLSTRPMAKGTVTANTKQQLDTRTWPELSKWISLCKVGEWFEKSATRVAMKQAQDRWFVAAIPWSEQRPEAIAGEHGPHVLMLFDEASSIPKPIWETAYGALTTGECLFGVFGNPTRPTGNFADCFGRNRADWIRQQVDARDMRRPGVNIEILNEWVETYGEDSDFVRVRVRGMFPRTGFNQFIPQSLIEEAQERDYADHQLVGQAKVMGADVATFGDDQSVIIKRHGLMLPAGCCQSFRGLDPVEFGDEIIVEANHWDPDAIFVDGIGVGAGTVGRIKQYGRKCINVGAAGSLAALKTAAVKRGASEEFKGLPTYMWGIGRQWLRDGGSLKYAPVDLIDDLSRRQYQEDPSTGLIQLESKTLMRARGEASTDHGDALMNTFALPVAAREIEFEAFVPSASQSSYDELAV